MDVRDTISIDKDGLIYFIGDDYYGHYTLEEFLEIVEEINVRAKEIKEFYQHEK